VIVDDDDLFGDGVNIAARLQEVAEPGGVAVSARVYEDVLDRIDVPFHDGGDRALKNIVRPIHVWHWAQSAVRVPAPRPQPKGGHAGKAGAKDQLLPRR
jgi:adenylate cyclase